MFGKGKALSQPTGECPQRSAGRIRAVGFSLPEAAARGSPYEKAKGLGRDRRYGGRMVLANQERSFWGTVMHAMAMAKKIRICIYIIIYIDPVIPSFSYKPVTKKAAGSVEERAGTSCRSGGRIA